MAERRAPKRDGTDITTSAVNTAVALNIGPNSVAKSVSSRQRIVQRNGRTVVHECETTTEESGNEGAQP